MADLKQFTDQIRAWRHGIRAEAIILAREGAEATVAYAKTNHEWVSRTGELEDSIVVGARVEKGGIAQAIAKATADHAEPQEFGFRHYLSGREIAPKPFMRPAAAQAEKELHASIANHMWRRARGVGIG